MSAAHQDDVTLPSLPVRVANLFGSPLEWFKHGGPTGIICLIAVVLIWMQYWSSANTQEKDRIEAQQRENILRDENSKRELRYEAKLIDYELKADAALKSQREFSKQRSDADRDAMKVIAASDKLTRDADRQAIVELTLEIKRLMERVGKMQMAAFIGEE